MILSLKVIMNGYTNKYDRSTQYARVGQSVGYNNPKERGAFLHSLKNRPLTAQEAWRYSPTIVGPKKYKVGGSYRDYVLRGKVLKARTKLQNTKTKYWHVNYNSKTLQTGWKLKI